MIPAHPVQSSKFMVQLSIQKMDPWFSSVALITKREVYLFSQKLSWTIQKSLQFGTVVILLKCSLNCVGTFHAKYYRWSDMRAQVILITFRQKKEASYQVVSYVRNFNANCRVCMRFHGLCKSFTRSFVSVSYYITMSETCEGIHKQSLTSSS